MAGLSVPSDYGLAGGSLLALANGKGDPNRKDFVTAQYHSVFSVTGEFMLRQGDYKLITCKPNDRHPFLAWICIASIVSQSSCDSDERACGPAQTVGTSSVASGRHSSST